MIDLQQSSEKMRHHWDTQKYPKLVYVETTNACDAKCTYCLYERMERPVRTMSNKDFEFIADKVKAAGLKIGAVFCFGEPLLDKKLFDKIRYGRKIDVMTRYLGLNTNCSTLTADRYEDIFECTDNITLSFPNVRDEFERLTKLDWILCYGNASRFIQYRDKHHPNFNIQIGCNDVTGHDRGAVKEAFKDYDINWARDAEIKWGQKITTGVIDRSIMYNDWACDGYKGALQIKPNGDCCFCAYDVIRNETVFANIFKDSWKEIGRKFKEGWRRPQQFCLRCEFWHNYYQMIDGGWRRGKHIDSSWQDAYLKDRQAFWEVNHKRKDIRFLTNSEAELVWKYLDVSPKRGMNLLNVGLGTGTETIAACARGVAVHGLDISEEALKQNTAYLTGSYKHSGYLPSNTFDLAVSHLVAQHMTTIDLLTQIKDILRSLKPDGEFAIQYASPSKDEIYREDVEAQNWGVVRRTPKEFAHLVAGAGGKIISQSGTKRFYASDKGVTDDACWNGARIRRVA